MTFARGFRSWQADLLRVRLAENGAEIDRLLRGERSLKEAAATLCSALAQLGDLALDAPDDAEQSAAPLIPSLEEIGLRGAVESRSSGPGQLGSEVERVCASEKRSAPQLRESRSQAASAAGTATSSTATASATPRNEELAEHPCE